MQHPHHSESRAGLRHCTSHIMLGYLRVSLIGIFSTSRHTCNPLIIPSHGLVYDIALATLWENPGVFACPVRKVLHQRFVVFSHAMTGREMQPLLAHERNLQGAELFRKRESSNGRSFKKHWEGFSGTPAKNAKSINIHPNPTVHAVWKV